MSEELEIILRAVDDATNIFNSISGSVEDMASGITGATDQASQDFTGMEENVTSFQESVANIDSTTIDDLASSLDMSTEEVERLLDAGAQVGGIPFNDAAASASELESSVGGADSAVQELGNDLDIINSSMLLQLSEQVGQLGDKAESMSQEMNEAAISVGQLATQTGIAEPQMVSLINNISNATFPNDEAMMYVKSLDQMGVSAENLGTSATNIDRINDAFGLGAQTTNSLAQELGVLGVDMNNVSSSFNALAYANSNTVGGMQNYYSFLRKYDSQFKELGFDVDQSSMIIAAATQKYGGGRAALSGLSTALEEADGDTRALEQALGMQAGSLDHASEITGEYEGQLQALADEEAEHKTVLDQLGAAWEDVSLSLSGVLSPLTSFMGLIGGAGSFALQINGLKTLTDTVKGFNLQQTISNALEGEGVIARAASALGIVAEGAAADGAAVSFGGLAIAEGAALWWVLLIIAAIGALIAIVYEVGKAFGWWDDVGGMLDAVWAGVNRLWQAFINHPDVQAIISTLTDAWNVLSSAIGGVISWIVSFFETSNSGDFDIVRALIDGIGMAWEALTLPIRGVITIIQTLIDAFTQVSTGQTDILSAALNVWNTMHQFINNILLQIITTVMGWAGQMLSQAVNAGSNFIKGVLQYMRTLPARVLVLLLTLYRHVQNQFTKMVSTAKTKANQIVTGVVSYLRGLPGKAKTHLQAVATNILSAGGQWVTNARNKAQDVVDGVVNTLSNLPGKVYNEFMGIGTKMLSAGSSLVKKAREIGKNIVQGLLDSMGIHSPGIIQTKVVQEFVDTVSGVAGLSNQAGKAGGLVGASIVDGFDNATTDLMSGELFNASTGLYLVEEAESTINVNENITLDLKNVPKGLDKDELMSWLKSAVGDKGLIRTLVENNDFQNIDRRVKESLVKKNSRRG